MSDMYGFGPEGDQDELQTGNEPTPQGFREWMGKVSKTMDQQRAEIERLQAEIGKQAVREALTKQGYAPEAANLYTGKPEGLNDWLSANGAALAKAGASAEGEQGAPQGTPATTVSPESQQAMAAINAAGTGAVPALSGEDALVARLNAANTEEEFNAIMREAGNPRF